MAASFDTIDAVLRAVLKYVPPESVKPLLAELDRVPGNKSFRETIRRLIEQARK